MPAWPIIVKQRCRLVPNQPRYADQQKAPKFKSNTLMTVFELDEINKCVPLTSLFSIPPLSFCFTGICALFDSSAARHFFDLLAHINNCRNVNALEFNRWRGCVFSSLCAVCCADCLEPELWRQKESEIEGERRRRDRQSVRLQSFRKQTKSIFVGSSHLGPAHTHTLFKGKRSIA